MPKSRFLLLAAAIFAYFGLILLSLVVAYPFGMILLVVMGGVLLLVFEAMLTHASQKPDASTDIAGREPLKFG